MPSPKPTPTPTPSSTPTPSPSETPTETTVIRKPSAPEFTLQLIDDYLQIEIQNQPIIDNGKDTANIFYNIRMKDHDTTDWHNTTVPDPSQSIRGYIRQNGVTGVTRLAIHPVDSIKDSPGRSDSVQVDYQIEAINGYLGSGATSGGPPIGVDPNSTPVIIVNTSGWSETQTVTIP